MDNSDLYIGREVFVHYEVTDSENGIFLEWYKGKLTSVTLGMNDLLTVTLKYEASSSFAECSETYTVATFNELHQGKRVYPYRFSDEEEVKSTGINEISQGPQTSSEIEEIKKRLRSIEIVLGVSVHKVFHNFSNIVSRSLQKYIGRLKKPSNGVDIVGASWDISMDCSLEDFTAFVKFLSTKLHTFNGNIMEENSVTNNATIEVQSFKEITQLFGITEMDSNKVLVVKRSDRKGSITSMKAIGTVIQNNEPSLPTLFCLGGDVTKWCDECLYFHRENNHKDQSGLYTAPFVRAQSHDDLKRNLEKVERTQGNGIMFKWVPNKSSSLCSTGIPHTILMGRLVLRIPFVVFNNMTVAGKVNESIKRSSTGNDSESSNSSW